MPRSYRHIKDYEYEIEKLRKEGYTSREIGNKLGRFMGEYLFYI